MDKIDEQRSIKVVERKIDTALGTITFEVQVENELFKHKTKEEIVQMVERELHQACIRYTLNDIASTNQAFITMKRREEK